MRKPTNAERLVTAKLKLALMDLRAAERAAEQANKPPQSRAVHAALLIISLMLLYVGVSYLLNNNPWRDSPPPLQPIPSTTTAPTPTCEWFPHRDGCYKPDGPCVQGEPCVTVTPTPTTVPTWTPPTTILCDPSRYECNQLPPSGTMVVPTRPPYHGDECGPGSSPTEVCAWPAPPTTYPPQISVPGVPNVPPGGTLPQGQVI
jgi:hypothetical protein